MALTASELIVDARTEAGGFTGAQKVSDARLLNRLSRLDQQVVQITANNAPDLLSQVTDTASISQNGNEQGYQLQDGIHYRDFVYVNEDNETTPIQIVMKKDQDRPGIHPAAYLETNKSAAIFYPIDPLGKRWDDFSEARSWFDPDDNPEFAYSYVPPGGGLSSLSDTLGSPDMAASYLVTELVLMILLEQPNAPQAKLQELVGRAEAERQRLMTTMTKFAHGLSSRPRRGRRHFDILDRILD